MKPHKVFNLAFAFMLCCGHVIAQESVVREQGVDGYSGATDATIYADRPDNSNGGHQQIFSGATVGSVRRALIRFELSDLPSDTATLEATLRLTLAFSGLEARPTDTYTLHRLTASWGEGSADTGDQEAGLGTAANPGDATWRARFHPDTLWATAGGDFMTTPSARLTLGRWDSVNPPNNIYSFSGPGLAADVRAWIARPETNFGWILIGAESGSRNARRFYSSEAAADPETRPRLTLSVTRPTTPRERIVNYLLGLSENTQGLDLNIDGRIDAADLIQSLAPDASGRDQL